MTYLYILNLQTPMEPLRKTRNFNLSPILTDKKSENSGSVSPYKIPATLSPDKLYS